MLIRFPRNDEAIIKEDGMLIRSETLFSDSFISAQSI